MQEDSTYLTVKEVAKRLKVNEHTVRRWIESRELHAIDLGGQYRITEEDLQEFVKKRRK